MYDKTTGDLLGSLLEDIRDDTLVALLLGSIGVLNC
jgi:hypothetical protein